MGLKQASRPSLLNRLPQWCLILDRWISWPNPGPTDALTGFPHEKSEIIWCWNSLVWWHSQASKDQSNHNNCISITLLSVLALSYLQVQILVMMKLQVYSIFHQIMQNVCNQIVIIESGSIIHEKWLLFILHL